jgi:hypothetical protein
MSVSFKESELSVVRVRAAACLVWRWAVTLAATLVASSHAWAQPAAASDDDWLGMENVSNRYTEAPIVQLWYYHQKLSSGAYSNMATLRYFQPIRNPYGSWRGVVRFDQSYFNSFGPSIDDPAQSRYQRGNTMITVWGNHPNVLPNWHGDLGFRVIFPVGNQGQWGVGPQAGMSYQTRKPEGQPGLSDFSPLARLMFGFNVKNNGFNKADEPPTQSALHLFPTFGFDLSPRTQLRLWDENGMVYSHNGGKWFVPIDAMLVHRLTDNFVVALGVSRGIIDEYAQYKLNIYGRISWYF